MSFPGLFVIAGPLIQKLQGSVSFPSVFQQTVHEKCLVVEVFCSHIRRGGSVFAPWSRQRVEVRV